MDSETAALAERSMAELRKHCAAAKDLAFNHCLVNEYQAGGGILAHTDGPAYEPMVAAVSLGSGVILQFESGTKLWLAPGSLLVRTLP